MTRQSDATLEQSLREAYVMSEFGTTASQEGLKEASEREYQEYLQRLEADDEAMWESEEGDREVHK